MAEFVATTKLNAAAAINDCHLQILPAYQAVFTALEQAQIPYCIYKGFEHLENALQAGNSEIDVLILDQNLPVIDRILSAVGFNKIIAPKIKQHHIYILYDSHNQVTLTIDLASAFCLGTKPYRAWRLVIVAQLLANSIWDETWQLRRISPADEALSCLLRYIADYNCWQNQAKQSYLKQVWQALTITELQDASLLNTVTESLGLDITKLQLLVNQQQLNYSKLYFSLRLYCTRGLIAKVATNYRVLSLLAQRIKHAISWRLGKPKQPIRKRGRLFVVAGVDGCGKSSQTSIINAIPYYQQTGMQRCYLGHAEFWLPGLKPWLQSYVDRSFKPLPEKLLLALLKFIDRRTRLLWIAYKLYLGNHVICDRYFYDDIMMLQTEVYLKRPAWLRLINKLLYNWLGIVPDKTFFLDIDAVDAYARKAEYPLAEVQENIRLYRKLFAGRKEVVKLNAVEPLQIITQQIIRGITEFDKY